MAKQKFDGVIEAVRYTPEGRVSVARAYLRRGPAFSDRILLSREDLVRRMESGEKFVVGKRLAGLGGMFEVVRPVQLSKDQGGGVRIATGGAKHDSAERDDLEGAPLF